MSDRKRPWWRDGEARRLSVQKARRVVARQEQLVAELRPLVEAAQRERTRRLDEAVARVLPWLREDEAKADALNGGRQ